MSKKYAFETLQLHVGQESTLADLHKGLQRPRGSEMPLSPRVRARNAEIAHPLAQGFQVPHRTPPWPDRGLSQSHRLRLPRVSTSLPRARTRARHRQITADPGYLGVGNSRHRLLRYDLDPGLPMG